MRIRAKETIKHHPYYLAAGDVVTVDDAAGELMVAKGWAENAETGESGIRDTDPATLDVHSATLGTSSKVKG